MFSLLHCHFESALRAIALTTPHALKKVHAMSQMESYQRESPAGRLHFFDHIVHSLAREHSIFTPDVLRRVIKQFLKELEYQKIEHADIRIGIISKRWQMDAKEVVAVFYEELNNFSGLSLSFLGALNLTKPLNDIEERLNMFPKMPLVGLDINLLPDDIGKLTLIAQRLKKLQKDGKKINLHLGELFDNKTSRQILSIITPNRIGHGVLLLNDEEICEELIKHDICLDMCPVSNTVLGVVDWRKCNPARKALSKGIPFTINTDDPLLFQTNFQKELELASLTTSEISLMRKHGRKYRYGK